MSDIAISVQNLGKRYRLGRRERRANTLSGALSGWLRAPVENLRQLRRLSHFDDADEDDILWALRDVSFEVKQGEVIGVIGHNGAGKSTLLKILSQITAPTRGRVFINGRVSSLLEVGTGFHSELTGRENIYLNGTVLGMTKREVDRKFDEIVDFSGVESFIDTPVKRYSSGMSVRLAFSVAAHLEPEILLVDEVLAVGDAEFQKKCLGKMEDVAQGGRTLLFVSHQMEAIQRLCPTSILLRNGRLTFYGQTAHALEKYLADDDGDSGPNSWISMSDVRRQGSGEVRFVGARFSSRNAAVADCPFSQGPLQVDLSIHSDRTRSVGSLAVTITDRMGTKLVNADTFSLGSAVSLARGANIVTLDIEQLHLNPGVYGVSLWLADRPGQVHDYIPRAFSLRIVAEATARFGNRPTHDGLVPCSFACSEPRAIDSHTPDRNAVPIASPGADNEASTKAT